MKTAIYPGSFDPVTNGHLDIIQRASKMFDKLVVVVLINPLKTYSFSMKERCEFLKETTKDIPNVEIASFDGLLADFFNQRSDVDVIVKGLRATTDFEYEFQMAHTNKDLNPRGNGVYTRQSQDYVRFVEHGKAGGDVQRRSEQVCSGVYPRADTQPADAGLRRCKGACKNEISRKVKFY